MTDGLTIAMPKGRIYEEAAELLTNAGIELPDDPEQSRRLIHHVKNQPLKFILAKPMDVPTYVEYGVADIGIAGKDVLLEEQRDVYEVLDLGISPCRLSVAGLPEDSQTPVSRIATKYPNTASNYFRQKGEQVEVIKLNGSIELAPLVGLGERIVDIVSSGRTLKENGLVETETIAEITSRLIINPTNYRLKKQTIDHWLTQIEKALKGAAV